MKRYCTLFLLVILFLLQGCDHKTYLESDEVTAITNGDLAAWTKSAPFNNYWNPQADSNGNMVLTNQQEVFPFLGKFKNDMGTLAFLTNPELETVYERSTSIFKDETWGESFTHATLLYEPTELFLSPFYSEGANIAFSGMSGINDRYSSNLAETQIATKNKNYKTALYWVQSNQQQYLSGFYQKDQLAFQFAFVFTDTINSIQKIKEINTTMNLNIPEWNNITPENLAINDQPTSFWQDPYLDLYHTSFLAELQVPLKQTDYKLQPVGQSDEAGVDYLFIKNSTPDSQLSFKSIATDKSSLSYQELMQDKDLPTYYNEFKEEMYLTVEREDKGIITLEAQGYFTNNRILIVKTQFSETDSTARREFENLLKTWRKRLL